MVVLTFAAAASMAFAPGVHPFAHAAPCKVTMRYSWTPPPRGTPGTPIINSAGSFGDEAMMIERAAAAANAGINGYQADSQAVRKAASDGAVNPLVLALAEPITDIW